MAVERAFVNIQRRHVGNKVIADVLHRLPIDEKYSTAVRLDPSRDRWHSERQHSPCPHEFA
jgi:hypothetical protein